MEKYSKITETKAVPKGCSDRDKRRKPFFGVSSLMLYFIITLGFGLSLHSLYRFIMTHHLPLHRKVPSSLVKPANDDWETVSYHGDISIQRHPMGKTQLYQYRYWLETSIPKDTIVTILADPNKTHEWMPWLVEKEQRFEAPQKLLDMDSDSKGIFQFPHEASNTEQVLSNFRYVMPYPGLHMRHVVAYHSIKDDQTAEHGQSAHTTKVEVKSLNDDDPNNKIFPLCDSCKRASIDLEFKIMSTANDSLNKNDEGSTTRILLVQFMNPYVTKLPLFMVNAMNQKWGIAALHRLVRLGHQTLGHNNSLTSFTWKDLKRSFQAALIPVEG